MKGKKESHNGELRRNRPPLLATGSKSSLGEKKKKRKKNKGKGAMHFVRKEARCENIMAGAVKRKKNKGTKKHGDRRMPEWN